MKVTDEEVNKLSWRNMPPTEEEYYEFDSTELFLVQYVQCDELGIIIEPKNFVLISASMYQGWKTFESYFAVDKFLGSSLYGHCVLDSEDNEIPDTEDYIWAEIGGIEAHWLPVLWIPMKEVVVDWVGFE